MTIPRIQQKSAEGTTKNAGTSRIKQAAVKWRSALKILILGGSSYSLYIRLIAILFTVAVLVIHPFIPARKFNLLQTKDFSARLYSNSTGVGSERLTWQNSSKSKLQCSILQDAVDIRCGFYMRAHKALKFIDISDYENLVIKIKSTGKIDSLRVFIRSINDGYSIVGDADTYAYSSLTLKPSELSNSTTIPLSDIRVADWWIIKNNLSPLGMRVNLQKVVDIGVVVPSRMAVGTYSIDIERLSLEGQWISAESLYLSLISAWLLFLFGEAFIRFIALQSSSRRDARRLVELSDHTERLKKESMRYQHLLAIDQLTGLLNRAGLAKKLREITDIHRASEDKLSYAMLLLDIDYFKHINDDHGHDIGDYVLTTVAQILVHNSRVNDAVCRWGGEEFLMLCPVTDEMTAQMIAEKIRISVAAYRFSNNVPNRVTVSIGVTMYCFESEFEQTFKACDTALYRAKNTGRNRAEFAASN